MPEERVTLYCLGLPSKAIPQPREALQDPLRRIKALLHLAGVEPQRPLSPHLPPCTAATESMGLRCLSAAITTQERTSYLTPLATVPAEVAREITKVVAFTDAPFTLGVALARGSLVYLSSHAALHLRAVPIPTEATITDVAAGAEHAVACTSDGDVYVWGFGNSWGQQGDGSVWRDVSESRDHQADAPNHIGLRLSLPKRLKCFGTAAPQSSVAFAALSAFRPAPIDRVACGRHHTLFLSTARKVVYSCGSGSCGQLGHGRTWELSPSPRALKNLFGCDVVSVHASPDADHSIAVLACGKVLAFGEGKHGVLGTGTTKNIWDPTSMTSHNDKHGAAAAGEESTADMEEGVDQTIARINREAFLYPRRVPRISNILDAGDVPALFVSTSETHTCVLTGDAAVLTCGIGGPIRLPMRDRTNLRLLPRGGLPPRSVSGVGEPSLASPSARLVDAVGALGRRPGSTSEMLVLDEVQVQTGGERAAVLRGAEDDGCSPTVLPIAGRGFTLFVDPEGRRGTMRMVGTICDSLGRVVFGSGMKGAVHHTGSIDVPVPGAAKRVFPFLNGAIVAVSSKM